MKKTTFSILFYGKKNGLKANGKMPVMGRITVNGVNNNPKVPH